MNRYFLSYWVAPSLFIVATVCCGEEPVDVRFRSGGKLGVKVLSESKVGSRKYSVVKTNSGGIYKLDKSKTILTTTESSAEQSEYDTLVEAAGDSSEAHWKLFEWCREKSRRNQFKDEALFHLREIVRLDPSDERAWKKFESVDRDRAYIRVNGQWVPEQQHYLSMGYVKVGGGWASSLQTEFNAKVEGQERIQNRFKDRIKKWHSYVLPQEEVSVVREKLFELSNPVSIRIIENFYLEREADPRIRSMYVEAIARVASSDARRILVKYLMKDPDARVQEQAMIGLQQFDLFDPAQTASLLARYLGSNNNKAVNQAARHLAQLNNEAALLPLMGSLTTTHKVATGNDPGRMSTTFGTNGNTGMSMGGPATVDVKLRNQDVLEALESITGQRFGFDAQAWREWYLRKYSTTEKNLRRSYDH